MGGTVAVPVHDRRVRPGLHASRRHDARRRRRSTIDSLFAISCPPAYWNLKQTNATLRTADILPCQLPNLFVTPIAPLSATPPSSTLTLHITNFAPFILDQERRAPRCDNCLILRPSALLCDRRRHRSQERIRHPSAVLSLRSMKPLAKITEGGREFD